MKRMFAGFRLGSRPPGLGIALAVLAFVFGSRSATSLTAVPLEARALKASSPAHEYVLAPDRISSAEVIRFDENLSPSLLKVPIEGQVRISGWPVAPGLRRDVLVQRHEIYAPGARIYKMDGPRSTILPRSKLVFFWGSPAGDDSTQVLVSVDPESATVRGLMDSPDGLHEIRPAPSSQARESLLARPEALLSPEDGTPQWACGQEETGSPAAQNHRAREQGATATTAITSLHTAIVGVDTDNEFMSLKFSDNTTTASNYIASLFAAVNVMYQRDLLVRLLQGTTFLRVSTTTDPYSVVSGGNANSAELNEFSTYWNTNYATVPHALAAMLSGKQPGTNSASGIAWITGLCNHYYGASFSQVFRIDYLAGDTLIVGHEIGHNFGSPHTHCYSPPIDFCYNQESGCYSGATSCPTPDTNGVTGTIMSYCHLLGGCSSAIRFHQRTIDLLSPNVVNSVGICIFPHAASDGDLSGDGKADIILRNYSTGQDALWVMNGSTFSAIQNLPALPNTSYRIEGVGDFNGDGKPDIVLRNYATGQNAVWVMNGTNLIGVVDLPAIANLNYHIGGLGDLNGDGQADIVWHNAATGQNAVWLMNGTGILSVVDLPAISNTSFEIAGCGDFNGDGKTDILLRNYSTGQNAVWLMNGTSFSSIVDLPALTNVGFRFSAVADYNFDSKPDIVLRNNTTGQNAIWLMNGATVTSVVDLPALVNPSFEIAGPR